MTVHHVVPRIRMRILIPLGIILLVSVIFSIVSIYFLQRQHLEKGVRRQLASVPQLFQGLLDNEARHISTLISYVLLKKEMVDAFAAHDRQMLLKRTETEFTALREKNNITHFYFHLPNRTCFLRVHKPEEHDDFIDRFTLATAAEQQREAYGIELGPFGTFTLRVVRPMRVDGELLGFIEFGRDIEYLTPELKKFLGMDFFVLVNHKYLDRALWEKGLRMLGRHGIWDAVPGHVVVDQTMAELPANFTRYISLPHKEKERLVMKMAFGKASVWGGFSPLYEASGREVGEIIALQDVTVQVSQQFAAGMLTLVGVMVVAVLFLFFSFQVSRMEKGLRTAHRELSDYQGRLEELVDDRTRELLLYRHIVDATRDSMAYVDRDYVYRAVNAEYCRLLGGSQSAFVGQTMAAVRGEEVFRKVMQPKLDRALAGEQVRYESWFDYADRVRRYMDVTYTPFRSDSGEPVGVVVSISDITERQKAQEALQHAKDELEKRVAERTDELTITYRQLLHAEKLSAVGKLAASIAHEFNNPICGINNVLEGLRKRVPMDKENASMVELAIKECQRVAKLTKDMQGFNRPSSGAKKPVDLHQLLDAMLRFCDKECRRHRIRVVRDYAEQLPPVVVVEDQIKQVVLNLFSNAVEAMEEQGGILAVETAQEGEQVVLRIQDTGPGIKPENLDHIFEPFFTTKPALKGTGLGLSVSYGIIESHGGAITVESEPGQGATFVITLPMGDGRYESNKSG